MNYRSEAHNQQLLAEIFGKETQVAKKNKPKQTGCEIKMCRDQADGALFAIMDEYDKNFESVVDVTGIAEALTGIGGISDYDNITITFTK